MTDLSNAEKYTPQFGFEPGVVVEITRHGGNQHIGYFVESVPDEGVHIKDGFGEVFNHGHSNIDSIRVLTGPFAAWQFAPSGTVAIHFDKANQKIQFCDAIDPAPWEYDEDWMLAPWWHQPKETKNEKSEAAE